MSTRNGRNRKKGKKDTEEILTSQRPFLAIEPFGGALTRKILGPLRLRECKDLYKNKYSKSMMDMIRKRLWFFGHIIRMCDSRLTKLIFNRVCKSKN